MAARPNHLSLVFPLLVSTNSGYIFSILKLQPDDCPTRLGLISLPTLSVSTVNLNSSGTIYPSAEALDNLLAQMKGCR